MFLINARGAEPSFCSSRLGLTNTTVQPEEGVEVVPPQPGQFFHFGYHSAYRDIGMNVVIIEGPLRYGGDLTPASFYFFSVFYEGYSAGTNERRLFIYREN